MNNEQAQILNTVQQVMRGLVASLVAVHPEKAAELSTTLAAFAEQPNLETAARNMLLDLSQGAAILVSATHRKQ
jgi:hypothetical protein